MRNKHLEEQSVKVFRSMVVFYAMLSRELSYAIITIIIIIIIIITIINSFI